MGNMTRQPNLDGVDQRLLDAYEGAKELFQAKYSDGPPLPRITYGFRSTGEQRAIRKKFGYPDDEKPSGWHGLPLAARPGTSKHEKGLAIDIWGAGWTPEHYRAYGGAMKSIESAIQYPISASDLCHVQIRPEGK